MDFSVKPSAENDLVEYVSEKDHERILDKLTEIENRLNKGIPPRKAIEKRLSGNWSPMLQQRVGNYRLWFVEGKNTEKGSENTVYCIRILTKERQQKLMGVNINPDTYL